MSNKYLGDLRGLLFVIEAAQRRCRHVQLHTKIFKELEEVSKKLHEAELYTLQILDVAEIETEKEVENAQQ